MEVNFPSLALFLALVSEHHYGAELSFHIYFYQVHNVKLSFAKFAAFSVLPVRPNGEKCPSILI